eukprot:Phypoly_transcript_06528.p1 GENE.Phypoly_transcript_06528~~Phypoly_transcript_06528.p1  ORF type:complete len:523 (+),score=60.27 Phypoly_transcript_06528:137-1705(+)
MMKYILLLLVCSLCVHSQSPPSRFLNYLLLNHWNTSNLPLSYRVPSGYWQNLKPEQYYNESIYNPSPCGRNITPTEMDNYRFQTEMMLTDLGLNLYDAAMREIALALLGRADVAQQYETDTLIAAKTFQFTNIRASAPCAGIMFYGKCTDPQQSGACGFCYGQNGVTLDAKHAYFFRMISDVWAFAGTVDQRCPEKNAEWTWNDYRPVTGENAWANFIGTFQVAYLQAGRNVQGISDSSNAMVLGVIMFQAFQTMQLPNGAIAYAPWNTYDFVNPALGGFASTENAASSLAALQMFLYVLQNNPTTQYKNLIPEVQTVIKGLLSFLQSAYNSSLGYFYQGGTLENGVWSWNTDPESMFAVDCQTWVMSVLGAPQVDAWFGTGTALKIWDTTMKLGGYVYDPSSDTVQGVGYSLNQQANVLSGEWTFGAINMLRIFETQYTDSATKQKLINQAYTMRQNIEARITFVDNTLSSSVIYYANKRYTIPWGWYANPVPSTASIAWAVAVDSNFNPFVLGGSYNGTV